MPWGGWSLLVVAPSDFVFGRGVDTEVQATPGEPRKVAPHLGARLCGPGHRGTPQWPLTLKPGHAGPLETPASPPVLSRTKVTFFFTELHGALPRLQVMDGPGENEPDLKPAGHPRFCEGVRRDLPPYTQLFTRVFQNKTFHVYRLARGP